MPTSPHAPRSPSRARRSLAALPVLLAAAFLMLLSACYIVPEPAPAAKAPAGTSPTAAATSPAPAAAGQPAPAPVAADGSRPVAAQPATAGAAPSAEDQALAAKAAQVVDDMARVAEVHKDNCDKAASEMKIVIEKGKPTLEASKKFQDDPGMKKWFEETYSARLSTAMGKLMPLMQNCQEHAGFKAVMESMN